MTRDKFLMLVAVMLPSAQFLQDQEACEVLDEPVVLRVRPRPFLSGLRARAVHQLTQCAHELFTSLHSIFPFSPVCDCHVGAAIHVDSVSVWSNRGVLDSYVVDPNV